MGEFEYMMLEKMADKLQAQLVEAKRRLQYYASKDNWEIQLEGLPGREKSVPPWVESDRGRLARDILEQWKKESSP